MLLRLDSLHCPIVPCVIGVSGAVCAPSTFLPDFREVRCAIFPPGHLATHARPFRLLFSMNSCVTGYAYIHEVILIICATHTAWDNVVNMLMVYLVTPLA
ncbi:MAG: hypothetical protein SFZ02_12350 [bacterium]|nr:hypothetical protein [bacterium]